jgi:hypothetical protein
MTAVMSSESESCFSYSIVVNGIPRTMLEDIFVTFLQFRGVRQEEITVSKIRSWLSMLEGSQS